MSGREAGAAERGKSLGQVTEEGGAFIPTRGVHPRNNTAFKKTKKRLESFGLPPSFS